MCSVGSICKFLVAFQLIFQYFNFVQPPISPRFFVSFLEFCSFPSVSHFSVVLFAVFLREPLFSFYSFILVKVVTYFLEFYFEFLFVRAIYHCNQFMSIIFTCVRYFLISPVSKQQ